MKKRDFLEKIIAANFDSEVTEFAQIELNKLDEKNSAAKIKRDEAKLEKESVDTALRDNLFALLTEEPKTAAILIAESGLDISAQKVARLMTPLVEAERVIKSDIKSLNGKGKQKGYSVVKI